MRRNRDLRHDEFFPFALLIFVSDTSHLRTRCDRASGLRNKVCVVPLDCSKVDCDFMSIVCGVLSVCSGW